MGNFYLRGKQQTWVPLSAPPGYEKLGTEPLKLRLPDKTWATQIDHSQRDGVPLRLNTGGGWDVVMYMDQIPDYTQVLQVRIAQDWYVPNPNWRAGTGTDYAGNWNSYDDYNEHFAVVAASAPPQTGPSTTGPPSTAYSFWASRYRVEPINDDGYTTQGVEGAYTSWTAFDPQTILRLARVVRDETFPGSRILDLTLTLFVSIVPQAAQTHPGGTVTGYLRERSDITPSILTANYARIEYSDFHADYGAQIHAVRDRVFEYGVGPVVFEKTVPILSSGSGAGNATIYTEAEFAQLSPKVYQVEVSELPPPFISDNPVYSGYNAAAYATGDVSVTVRLVR